MAQYACKKAADFCPPPFSGFNSSGSQILLNHQCHLKGNGIVKFTQLLRAVCRLGISHIQFNVLNEADLKDAQAHPENYRGLTVRVAGYTAYFTELARDLQDEIIARTTYEAI